MKRPSPAEQIASAKTAIRSILVMPILERHRNELLSVLIWKITQAEGKYTLRYRSAGALAEGDGKKQHEHVFPRKWLIEQLKARPDNLDDILDSAVACVVTEEEHRRLTAIGPSVVGWDRYRMAKILVFDTKENTWLIPAP